MSEQKTESDYVPERGYWTGPTLDPGQKPWSLGWEQDPFIDNGHGHQWELVTLPPHPATPTSPAEQVVRCNLCHAPRCGDSTDRDPCMERRHHRDLHLTLHGSFEPVGGYLREEQADA